LKLLLDEMYAVQIAEQLRSRGHDVIAVKERPDLVGVDDEPLLERAAAEDRVLLTNNVGDFSRLVQRLPAEGRTHHGVVLTNDRSMPRTLNNIATYARELEAFMKRRPEDDAMRDHVAWLPEAGHAAH
jgi:predicted nuclease of predicted toxin-antitoxin system